MPWFWALPRRKPVPRAAASGLTDEQHVEKITAAQDAFNSAVRDARDAGLDVYVCTCLEERALAASFCSAAIVYFRVTRSF